MSSDIAFLSSRLRRSNKNVTAAAVNADMATFRGPMKAKSVATFTQGITVSTPENAALDVGVANDSEINLAAGQAVSGGATGNITITAGDGDVVGSLTNGGSVLIVAGDSGLPFPLGDGGNVVVTPGGGNANGGAFIVSAVSGHGATIVTQQDTPPSLSNSTAANSAHSGNNTDTCGVIDSGATGVGQFTRVDFQTAYPATPVVLINSDDAGATVTASSTGFSITYSGAGPYTTSYIVMGRSA